MLKTEDEICEDFLVREDFALIEELDNREEAEREAEKAYVPCRRVIGS